MPQDWRKVGLEGARFVAVFAVVALLASFALQYAFFLNDFAASSSQFVMSGLGKPSQYYADGAGVPHLRFDAGVLATGGVDAEFNDLCAGKLELAVLLGILVASADRKWRARLLGFLVGALVLFLFNPLRASVTLLLSGSAWLGVVHDFLFRVSLVLLIVVFYAAWYLWLSRTKFFAG